MHEYRHILAWMRQGESDRKLAKTGLFMVTLTARTDPTMPASEFLSDHEWKVLFLKTYKNKPLPKTSPHIGDVIKWIAKLGGYLARKGDGPPGTITL